MAEDEAYMRARIAAVAGAINLRQQQIDAESAAGAHRQHHPTRTHRGGYQQHLYYNRWGPYYARARGRGRGGGYAPLYQNRTLVNSPTGGTTGATPSPASSTHSPPLRQQNLQVFPDAARLAQAPRAIVTSRELTIEGIRFTLKEDGSKLTRVTGES